MGDDVQRTEAATQIDLVLRVVVWREALGVESDRAVRGHLVEQVI